MQHFSVLMFLLAWPPQTQSFNPEEIAPVIQPICDDDYEGCIPDEYDACEDKIDSETGGINFDYYLGVCLKTQPYISRHSVGRIRCKDNGKQHKKSECSNLILE